MNPPSIPDGLKQRAERIAGQADLLVRRARLLGWLVLVSIAL